MKKNYFVAFALSLGFSAAQAQLGSGTSVDPYQITTCDELQKMETKLSAYWILMKDIDCAPTQTGGGQWTSTGFRAVGDSTNPFTGNFNGKCYVIKNLYINTPSKDWNGLFGFTKSPATIQGVGLVNVIVKGKNFTGAVIGYKLSTTMNDCYSNGYVSGAAYTGGVVGRSVNYQGTPASITNCYSRADVLGTNATGGVVGQITTFQGGAAYLTNCFSEGNVTGNNSVGGVSGDCATYQGGGAQLLNCYAKGNVKGVTNVGGLSGEVGPLMGGGGYVIQSYATGNVTGTNNVGGLVGDNGPNSGGAGVIYNSYARGNVSGTNKVGGLVGNQVSTGTGWGVDTSYSTGLVSGTTNVGGLIGYENSTASYNTDYYNSTINPSLQDIGNLGNNANIFASTTAQMQTQATYTSWRFPQIWLISNANYPTLAAPSSTSPCNFPVTLKAAFNYNTLKNCLNDTVSFTDKSNNSPNIWAWNFGDPSSGVNNVSTLQNPTHKFTAIGTYQVKLVATKGLTKDSVVSPVIVISCSTGMNENSTNVVHSIYPNPNNGEFAIDVYSDVKQVLKVKVVNVIGQVLSGQQLTLQGGISKVPVKVDAAPGVYFVILQSSNFNFSEKLVIR